MGKTFEQLKLSLRDWLDVDIIRLPDASAGDIINIVQREILRKYELRYGEYTDTFTTVASPLTCDYDVPSGWSKPFNLWYISPSVNKVVFLNGPLPKDQFDTVYPDSTVTGDAIDYCVWGGKIRLGYTPNAVYTVTRNYYRTLTDLTDDDGHGIVNHNIFTDNAWEVILFNALVYTTRYLIEDSRIAMWEAKAKELLRDLVREDGRARSIGKVPQAQEPGTLAPYPFWFNQQATP